MKKELKRFVTTYRNQMIVIHNVPCYTCHYSHFKASRKTRERIESLLKEAYAKGISEIDFIS